MPESNPIISKQQELIKLFNEYDIDFNLYGAGEAKAISDLAKEIIDGEAEIVDCDGRLQRRIGAVAIKLLYIDVENYVLKLSEDKQVFRDGRVRVREPLYDMSIVEKIYPGENKVAAIARGVLEEIGIDISNLIVDEPECHSRLRSSKSYPGIQTNQETFVFPDVVIAENDFNPDGYIEVQENKTTYFVWKREK